MGALGEKLKAARESMGLSLREVEEATKIRKKYLQALEKEEFDVIPGKTYAKGFLKIYAKFLNLDHEEILEEFENIFTPSEEEKELEITKPIQAEQIFLRKSKPFKYIAAVIGILVLLFAVNLFMSNIGGDSNIPNNDKNIQNEGISMNEDRNDRNSPSVKEDKNSAENKEEPPLGPNEQENQEQIEGVEIEIEIVEQECWVRVRTSSETLYEGIMKEGEKRVFQDESELTITLGNAGAARVVHNGTELPSLGRLGEVITRTFEKES
ncbi:MAG: helix-turn-helix domain-containing protein [Clostridia bacterium]|nr:helix-turn-helix domain-containing protein [Clostridia bacterium]